jgi:hypothetical protein
VASRLIVVCVLQSVRPLAIACVSACLMLLVTHDDAHSAQLTLTWVDQSDGETGFSIERKATTTGVYGVLAKTSAGTITYVDTSVAGGSTYCYRVQAFNGAGSSPYSNEACATVPLGTFTISVTDAGQGTGTVTSNPAGISCGSTCTGTFSLGKAITLTATPGATSTFSGWSGGGCSGTGTCTITSNNAITVTATFAPTQKSHGRRAHK